MEKALSLVQAVAFMAFFSLVLAGVFSKKLRSNWKFPCNWKFPLFIGISFSLVAATTMVNLLIFQQKYNWKSGVLLVAFAYPIWFFFSATKTLHTSQKTKNTQNS